MSSQLDLQSILFPFLYTAPSELPKYTSKAIQQTAKYISTDPTFDNTDYKSCIALKTAIAEAFGLWHPIWNGDSMCYPVDGTIADVLQELTPDGSYQEMYEASIRRFTTILEKVAYVLYPNTSEAAEDEVQKFIYGRFWKCIDKTETEIEEAYTEL